MNHVNTKPTVNQQNTSRDITPITHSTQTCSCTDCIYYEILLSLNFKMHFIKDFNMKSKKDKLMF